MDGNAAIEVDCGNRNEVREMVTGDSCFICVSRQALASASALVLVDPVHRPAIPAKSSEHRPVLHHDTTGKGLATIHIRAAVTGVMSLTLLGRDETAAHR
jgi:hypothetical protein